MTRHSPNPSSTKYVFDGFGGMYFVRPSYFSCVTEILSGSGPKFRVKKGNDECTRSCSMQWGYSDRYFILTSTVLSIDCVFRESNNGRKKEKKNNVL